MSRTMHSAIYEGSIRHRRFGPVRHEFRHRLAMAFIDLEELEDERRPLRVARPRAWRLVRFQRRDYLGPADVPLSDCVRALVAERCGKEVIGPIRMLTQVRTAGWNFNPITLYYCVAPGGESLDAVVFEVTNTPWSERHAYVVVPDSRGSIRDVEMAKALHVSPFMPMNVDYRFSTTAPSERLAVRFVLRRNESICFDADLTLRRTAALDRRGIRRLALRYPFMPLVVSAQIYGEAARLIAKRTPFHRHPPQPAELGDDEGGRKVA